MKEHYVYLPKDISTLVQEMKMVGANEKRSTYPHFMLTKEGELLFHYRDGGSGNGNEIYNIYSCENKSWYNAFGEKIDLPATLDNKSLIVDPIPVKGGIINLAARLCLDESNNPVFTYHKYDSIGNIQFYIAQIEDHKWNYKQITNWDYRWEFSGNGTIGERDVQLKSFQRRDDGNYEIAYGHLKYGHGTLLLNNKFEPIGKVLKAESFGSDIIVEGTFPGLLVKTSGDIGKTNEANTRYILKWETLNANRDEARPKPWPQPSRLLLYKLKKVD